MAPTLSTTPASVLTPAQRAVLCAALAHPAGVLTPPAKLHGRPLLRLTESLLDKNLVRELRTKSDYPRWRRDGVKNTSLVLTKAGRTRAEAEASALVALEGAVKAATVGAAPSPSMAPQQLGAATIDGPRDGSKLAEVVTLLRRDKGSTMAELMAVTGWLPHTTRAALTGLRRRGYSVLRQADAAGAGSVYRIDPSVATAAA